jgi:hypothetical protein
VLGLDEAPAGEADGAVEHAVDQEQDGDEGQQGEREAAEREAGGEQDPGEEAGDGEWGGAEAKSHCMRLFAEAGRL